MELKEFVAETIKQIIDGVSDAQEYAANKGATVNPTNVWYRADQGVVKPLDRGSGTFIKDVHFDVAVTAAEGTQTKGGIGVFVGAVGLGSQGQTESSSKSQSRIKFSVPLVLPVP